MILKYKPHYEDIQMFDWVNKYFVTRDGSDERWFKLFNKNNMFPNRCYVCFEIDFISDIHFFASDPLYQCVDCELRSVWLNFNHLDCPYGDWLELLDDEINWAMEDIFDEDMFLDYYFVNVESTTQ